MILQSKHFADLEVGGERVEWFKLMGRVFSYIEGGTLKELSVNKNIL